MRVPAERIDWMCNWYLNVIAPPPPTPPHRSTKNAQMPWKMAIYQSGRQPLTEFVIGVAPVDGPSGEVLS